MIHTNEAHISQAPQDVRIFVNQPSIGFEDVEDAQTAQAFVRSEEDARSGKPILLHYVRFQNVNSLHVRIFVESE